LFFAVALRLPLSRAFPGRCPPAPPRGRPFWPSTRSRGHQDGFYQFEVDGDSTKAAKGKEGSTASAKSIVMRGGSGTLRVELTFNGAGKLSGVSEDNKVRAGPRPICQATKLLDRDRVVREMAERDLLIMGKFAGGYLQEQRAKAPPELRKVIDRLWKRIVEDREGDSSRGGP
jgi:hypothetical protein